MKNLRTDLVEKNLHYTYFNPEDGTYDLLFKVAGKDILVRMAKADDRAMTDEDYWTEESIRASLEDVSEEQIEVRS